MRFSCWMTSHPLETAVPTVLSFQRFLAVRYSSQSSWCLSSPSAALLPILLLFPLFGHPPSQAQLIPGSLHKKSQPRIWTAQDLVPVVNPDSNFWFPSSCLSPLPPLPHAQTELALVRAGEVPEFQGWLEGRGVGKSLWDMWGLQAERGMKTQKTP